MARHHLTVSVGVGLLLLGMAGAGTAVWLLTGDPLLAAARSWRNGGVPGLAAMPFEHALSAVLAAVLLVGAAWSGTVTSLAAAATLVHLHAGRPRPAPALVAVAEHGRPRPVRRWVALALGATVGAVAVSPAVAGPVTEDRAPRAPSLSGLALPDRPTGAPPPPCPPASPGSVVVRAGDSLWSVSERLLAGAPTDREVSVAWHRLYGTNRRNLGPDPDLIQPDTRLRVPPLLHSAPRKAPP